MSDKEKETSSEVIDISLALTESNMELPLFRGISAGFPSPSMDFIDLSIDLNKQLIKHPSATYYGRVKGESMCDVGINDGDLLVIDKSIEPENGNIAVCFLDGDFTLKRIKIEKDGIWLMPANKGYKPIYCTENNELSIWGVVTYVIKSF